MSSSFSAIRDLLEAARARAVGAAPETRQAVRLANRAVRVSTFGELEWFHEPFRHLEEDGSLEPRLEIRAWIGSTDETTSAALVPENEFGELFRSDDERILLYRLPGFVSMLDRDAGTLDAWIVDLDLLPSGERARPLQFLLTVWLADEGIEVVHSGVVEDEGRGALFAGMSGAGKSSTTIACVEAGLGFLGDDFMGIEKRGDEFVAHSLFGSCSLEHDTIARFPSLAEHSYEVLDDKTIVSVSRRAPSQMRRVVPVRALLLPRITGKHHVSSAAPRDGFLRLAPSSIVRRPVPPGRLMRVLRELSETVPVWWIDCGRDSSKIADDVRRVLRGAQ